MSYKCSISHGYTKKNIQPQQNLHPKSFRVACKNLHGHAQKFDNHQSLYSKSTLTCQSLKWSKVECPSFSSKSFHIKMGSAMKCSSSPRKLWKSWQV